MSISSNINALPAGTATAAYSTAARWKTTPASSVGANALPAANGSPPMK